MLHICCTSVYCRLVSSPDGRFSVPIMRESCHQNTHICIRGTPAAALLLLCIVVVYTYICSSLHLYKNDQLLSCPSK
ncbi:unnamed protein product [Cuscuta campestris]|uniref:Uncharacterized protein n=1 Tax=Cuscuta campestris TaxID=132261 RepID=A0A484LX03_9ASTE|nr:unnamed protein product [Cuscuta campestris]